MSGARTVAQETYLPAPNDSVAEVYDFIAAHEKARGGLPEPQYFLSGPDVGDQVALPAEVYQVLRKVVDAMSAGLAVNVAPVSQRLTTQQAADLLGVSRPTLIKMLDAGQIPFEKVGTHRRVRLGDVIAVRARRRDEQYAALAATAVHIDDEEDLHSALASLRQARASVAASRRQRPSEEERRSAPPR